MPDGRATIELRQTVVAFAAGLPEAWEDHPWGEQVFKVGKRVFVFLGAYSDDPGFRLTIKLRDAHDEAMARYGLDRGG